MSKLFFTNALAVIAMAFPVVALADTTLTLSSPSTLNLDTGATVTSGGDLLWDGTNLTPQGTATAQDRSDLLDVPLESFTVAAPNSAHDYVRVILDEVPPSSSFAQRSVR